MGIEACLECSGFLCGGPARCWSWGGGLVGSRMSASRWHSGMHCTASSLCRTCSEMASSASLCSHSGLGLDHSPVHSPPARSPSSPSSVPASPVCRPCASHPHLLTKAFLQPFLCSTRVLGSKDMRLKVPSCQKGMFGDPSLRF